MRRQTCALALAMVLLALASVPAQAATTNVTINRVSGTCPAFVAVHTTTVVNPAGATVDVTAMTSGPALVSELVSATPAQLEFHAMLKPQFKLCDGTGHDGSNHFTLHGGRLTYVIRNTVSSGQFPRILELDVNNGNVHVKMGIAD